MRHRIESLLWVLAATALLASCSAVKLSYEKADWLLVQWAERYVDLTGEQARVLRTGLADLQRWHRSHELPGYADSFDALAARVERGMTRPDIADAVDLVRMRTRVLGEHAGHTFGPALAMLSESQLQEMESRFATDNRRFEKRHLTGSAADLSERRTAWLVERLEDWFGTLDRVQRARVERLVHAFPDMPAVRLVERKRRQAALLEAARAGRDGGAPAGARLTALLGDPERGRPAPVSDVMRRWEQAFIDMLAELEDSLTSTQRAHAAAKLRAYAGDFRELAARSGSAL